MLSERMRLTVFFSALIAVSGFALADTPVTVTILHSNDLHAHLDPTSISKKPYGGYARQATLIKRFRASDPNVLLLNAGDVFQGTMYFNVYEGLADLAFMNQVGYQAMALGNHEFDRGPSVLSAFVKRAAFPVLSSNLDFTKEPALNGLVQPYAVVHSGDLDFGIVGATTPDVLNISSPGPNITTKDLYKSVQDSVDALNAKGIKKVIVLTHIGYAEDRDLAHHLKGVSLIVGGHSHTPLGTPALPGWPASRGEYPTNEKDSEGKDVYIVQAWEWGKVFGRIQVHYDANGRVDKVLSATPIPVDESIPEDPSVASLMAAVQKPIAAEMSREIGYAPEAITNMGPVAAMGDVLADSMFEKAKKYGAVAAFVNSGGVRGGFEAGKITFGMATSVQPFRNTLVVLDVTGDELMKSLEIGVGNGGMLLPSAGTSYTVNASQPVGSRVSNVLIAGQPLDPAKTYTIGFANFTANGGDNHAVLKAAQGKRVDTGLVDIDGLVEYIKAHSPLTVGKDRRITFHRN